MDLHSNLEYLCRVCAANTKGRNSVAECVYILKTVGLKDKLDKFLYLKVSENDSLPKVLCKSCFRQVEATASLSKIAKHTQQVFRDFLLSNLPKGPSESTCTAEFTSSDFMGNKSLNEKTNETAVSAPVPMSFMVQQPPPAPTPILPPPLVQPLTTTATRKDDVVVNVSVADPLTRDNQQKMISNSQRRQSSILESRFTPKSIAQKQISTTMAPPRSIAPKPNQLAETINIINNQKMSTPVINFYPVKTQQQTKPQQQQQQRPQATQITTFSSGGYVIGRINANFQDKEQPKKSALPLTSSADNILQQKRKNLVKALNNIKANNSGQVSLLKSSQQKQAEALQNNAKTPLNEVANEVAEDALPERIIIAAPKNKSTTDKSKKEPLNLSSKIPAKIVQLSATASTAAIAAANQQQQEQTNLKPAFPDDITLGRVIRDMDLLKLILKALKWPVNRHNSEMQLQRLRNSKFTDIMSDTNLLQDTDLTQLLGPYLAPVLLAAQALQQQQQQILNNNASLSNKNVATTMAVPTKMTDLEAAQAEINKSIPYKLPPETSVQLVPATPEETEVNQSPSQRTLNTATCATASMKRERSKETKPATVPPKKQRKSAAPRARDSIVISDEEDSTTVQVAPKKSRPRSNKSNPSIQFDLNPSFMSQFNLLTGSGGNEADELMALLLKQKAALVKDNKVQNRRRNSVANLIHLPPSEFDSLIDLDDDIVLMEPVSTTSSESSSATSEQQSQKTDITNTFVIPSLPLITRPIIKRRKTVIHLPKNRFDLSTEIKNNEPTQTSSVSLLKTKEKLMEEIINQVATGNIPNSEDTIPSNPTQTVMAEKAVVVATAAEMQPVKASPVQQKKIHNKSSLGKQLLEAIGLQKLPSKIMTIAPNETPSSSTVTKTPTALPNSKQSVQQIRSALKKSLKRAQEQQQQKKKESSSSATNTVIQDADSTTKPAILVVEGKANKAADNCSSEVDVEEQIAKVTLMVRKNDQDTSKQSTNNDANSTESQERKEANNSSTNKNQERHCATTKQKTGDKEKSNEDHEETDNEKLQKEDSAKITSSSAAENKLNEATSAEIITPKRRGRKRLVDKLLEQEAADAKEKENDNKAISAITDKSIEEESETSINMQNEEETESNKTSGRPARQSKTQSKYYKGPDKPAQGRRSLPSRTTRNRKYC